MPASRSGITRYFTDIAVGTIVGLGSRGYRSRSHFALER